MKAGKLVAAIALCAGVLLLLGTCASTKLQLPTDNFDELVGTWVNTEYTHGGQRIVVDPDGVYVSYRYIDDTTYSGTGRLELIEKWTDSKGNIFCKIRFDRAGYLVYELDKISNSGSVLEYVQSYQDYPAEINPNELEYRVYYRQ